MTGWLWDSHASLQNIWKLEHPASSEVFKEFTFSLYIPSIQLPFAI